MDAFFTPDETERLRTLSDYNILDTPPEASFDRLTRILARHLNVPIALLSFIDTDRQWYKSCIGLEARETERSLSFCAHTILSDRVLVIPDTRTDPRFKENPAVVGPAQIRSYAGVPLQAPNGQNVGSLCVLDTVPRTFSKEDLVPLTDLAAMAMDQLELRRTGLALRDRETDLRQALRENSQLASAIEHTTGGVIITDPHQPDNPITYANPGFCAVSGYSLHEVMGRSCRLLQGPDTDPETVRSIRDALKDQRPLTTLILNYRKDGTPFMNELIINPVFDETGALLSFVGLQHDVTAREQLKHELEALVRSRTADLSHAQVEILNRLARAAEFRDDATGQHTQRVATTAARLARSIGLSDAQVTLIQQAAPLHDVGKIGISDGILLKAGRLTEREYATMQTHAAIGASLLSGGHSEVVQMAERIAESHHERWDGTGYPHRRAKDQIPLEGRLVAIADVFDALTHDRPYKPAWSVAEAVSEIQREGGKQFDPDLVEAFLKLNHNDLVSTVTEYDLVERLRSQDVD